MTRVETAAAESIAELTGRARPLISDDDRLVEDLGIDLMLAVSLLVAIEDRLEVALPDGCEGSLVAARTFGELVRCLSAALSEGIDDTAPH